MSNEERRLGMPGGELPTRTRKESFVALPRIGDLARSEQQTQAERE